jgi:hypothetical protein
VLSHPDVLGARGGGGELLHYAPATVLNLLEGGAMQRRRSTEPPEHFRELDGRYPPEAYGGGSVPAFYVAVGPAPSGGPARSGSHADPLLAATLCRLSPLAELALADCYLLRSPSAVAPAYLSVPDEEVELEGEGGRRGGTPAWGGGREGEEKEYASERQRSAND